MLSVISTTGGGPILDRLRRVSESMDEMQTLVGLRNTLASSIDRLQDKFIDILTNEYPSRHSLVDTRKMKENIKIQLGIRAATTSSMVDN